MPLKNRQFSSTPGQPNVLLVQPTATTRMSYGTWKQAAGKPASWQKPWQNRVKGFLHDLPHHTPQHKQGRKDYKISHCVGQFKDHLRKASNDSLIFWVHLLADSFKIVPLDVTSMPTAQHSYAILNANEHHTKGTAGWQHLSNNKVTNRFHNGALLAGTRGHCWQEWRVEEIVARGNNGDLVLAPGLCKMHISHGSRIANKSYFP